MCHDSKKWQGSANQDNNSGHPIKEREISRITGFANQQGK
jgi:hypothetical protein